MTSRNDIWVNGDGLKVGFGARTTRNEQSAPYRSVGLQKQAEFRIFGEDIKSTDTGPAFNDSVPIPAGAIIDAVQVLVVEAFTAAGIDIGLKEKDGTAIAADGFVAAGDMQSLGVVAGAGSLIGTELAVAGYPSYSGPAQTAGEAVVIVKYTLKPSTVNKP